MKHKVLKAATKLDKVLMPTKPENNSWSNGWKKNGNAVSK